MAVKAILAINGFEPNGLNYKISLSIWDMSHNIVVSNDVEFGPSTMSSTVNNALSDFVKAYIQDEWGVVLAALDTVKLLNPVSTI